MPISWTATGAMLSGWGALGGAAAIVMAALVGRSALSDYKKQKNTDKEIDVADAAMTAAYRAEEAIEGMRARWMPAAELNATEEQLKELGMKLDGMPNAEKSAIVNRGVIYRRAEYFKEDFDAVFEIIPRARAYFGNEVAEALKSFPRARNRILSSSDMLPMLVNDGHEDRETSASIRRDIYGKWKDEDSDPVGEMVSDGIKKLEQVLLPIIRPKEDNV